MTIQEAEALMDSARKKSDLLIEHGLHEQAKKIIKDVEIRIAKELPAKLRPSETSKKYLNKFITVHPAMIKLKERVASLVCEDDSVLIIGESGTGKECLARALHGERGDSNFVDINCAGLPTHLIESELFGHIRGAFTDASTDKMGLFEVAKGGTLFLDEIGELPLEVQAKLLRVLQEGRIRPVGANYSKDVSVRIVAATHHNLPELVQAGKFRLDLYARLSTIELITLPIRVRRCDIELIVKSLSKEPDIFNKMQDLKKDSMFWKDNDFPLNVRDIQRYVRRFELFREI
jgi:transcriptional regulator with GAF, ATPase, and Fis domain